MKNHSHFAAHLFRNLLLGVWSIVALSILSLYFFQNELFQQHLRILFAAGTFGYISYFILCCLRGFTLVPATYLTTIGILLFPPGPLMVLTLIGILFSSLCIYHFAGSFRPYAFFERKHRRGFQKIRQALDRNELSIVILWNVMAIVPADLISYTCGVMKTNRNRFILGTLIGQGIYSAILIFGGSYLINLFSLWF